MKNQSPSKKEGSFLFSTSLIFDENIDKLWLHLKDLSAETKIVDFLDNFKLIKGENTWTSGNTFSIYWIGVSNIEIKCISSKATRMKKKIKWKFMCDIGINYYKTMILYRITESDKTLVKIIMTRVEKNKLIDFSPQLSYYINLQYDILNFQAKYLQNLKKDKNVYQSCIIDKNLKKIWDFLLYSCDLKKVLFYRITKFLTPIKAKSYKWQIEAVGTDLTDVPVYIEMQVSLIEQNKTYFSLLFNFKNKSDEGRVNKLEVNLKNLINKIKEYINENEKEFNSDL